MTQFSSDSQSFDELSENSSADGGIDLETFNELKALLEADLADFIAAFISDTETRLDAIRNAIDTGDLVSAAQTAHSLKGSALNLGATGLARQCFAMEHASQSRSAVSAQSALFSVLEQLDSDWQDTRTFMQQQC